MKKNILLLFAFFLSFSVYSQFPTPGIEGFENTTGPDALPSTTWTLGTGAVGNQWAVFGNNVGTGRWGINNTVVIPPLPPLVYQGANSAYINRVQTGGAGLTSESYLATPRVTIPPNGQLRFYSRSFTDGNTGTFYDIKWAPGTANQTLPASYTNTLVTYTEDQLTFDDYTGVQNPFNIYTEKIINFPAAMIGTQVYIAFIRRNTQLGTQADGDRWLIDAVQLNQRCLDPTTLATAGILSTSANLTWANPSGATSWEIEVLPVATAPTRIGALYSGTLPYSASTTSYGTALLTLPLIQTPLTPNTAYKYYVRAVCSGSIPSNWVGPFNFTTTTAPPVCGGNYVDPGGPTANYPNNVTATNGTTVICPTNPGDQVTVTFTSFATQANSDILSIFDGNSSTGTLLGAFSGNTLPPSFTSSAANGCLTFVFTSNGATNAAGWIANVTCAPPPPCQKPTALVTSALLSTSVSLGWTNVGVGTSWQVLALPCTAPAPTAATTGWTATTSNPFVITGLNSATCYNLYVRSDCSSTSNGVSLWAGPVSVTTQVAPPICGGNFVDSGGPTANYANTQNITTTICPTIPGEKVTVTFTSFNTEGNFDGLYVYNGNSVTPGQLLPSANGPGFGLLTLAGSYWGNLTGANLPGPFTSTSADGCLTFVFISDGSVTNPGWVGNITCALPPTCQQPTNLTVTAITTTSAQLGWVSPGTATSWQVIALPAGSAPPNATTIGWTAAPTNPFVLNGLIPGTAYEYYVRGDCGVQDGVSLWSGPLAFSTIPTCPAPTTLTATVVLTTSAQLNWTSVVPSVSWQVIALPCGSAAPTAATTGWTAAPTNPFVLTGLTPATCYDFYVRGVCTPTDISFWSPLATATTQALPPICGGNFVDVGGVAGDYPNNSNSTVTICPITPGDQVTVTFTFFDTEDNFDGLYVYNGSTVTTGALLPSANGPGFGQLTIAGSYWGTLTGGNLPGPFTSSAPDGCLTFVFISDGSVDGPGWNANVTCAPAPTCAKPINLTAVINSSTSATLNWTQPANPGGGTATQWQVIVQPVGGPIPTVTTTTGVIVNNPPSPPYTVTGLTPGTNYEFWVRAICSTTDSSPWGGPRTFFTQTSCGDALPFCGNTGLSYTNTVGAPSYGSIDCLNTTPNPAWYFMQVNQSGNLNFQIGQTSTATGNGLDVDFVTWGPFTQAQYATLCNNLYDFPDGNTGIPDNVIACSYSIAPIENFTITNAVAGNYYMVLITNFSNQAGSVTFTQTNNGQVGSGTTNCAIVCSVNLGNDVSVCNATQHTITATTQGATGYAWYFNGSTTPIPGETGQSLTVTQSGSYQCIITCGLNTAQDTVIVTFNTLSVTVNSPSFCVGSATVTATPSVPGTYTYTWTVPVGATNPGNVASFSTTTPGTYTVVINDSSSFCNSDFESPTATGAFPNLFNETLVPCWDTTASDNIIEIWPPGFEGVTAYSGNQLIELNANFAGTLFQDFIVTPGASLTISFAHRGRQGNDVVGVEIGPVGGPYVSLGNFTDDNLAWVLHTLNYTVPLTGGNNYSLRFVSVSSTGGDQSIGNLLDAISVTGLGCTSQPASGIVTLTPGGLPLFTQIPNICLGQTAPTLPTTSNNTITGTWSPTTIDTSVVGTSVYTFTPDANQCATNTTMSITIDAPSILPIFTQIPSICLGQTAPTLPLVSDNGGITGTWSPTIIDTSVVGTTTYTFTPDANQCATNATMSITIDAPTVAAFAQIAPICQGGQAPLLPTTSSNNIAGTWSPATISTTTAGTSTYTFTSTTGLCASGTTMQITIHPTPIVNTITDVDACDSYSLPILLVGNYFAQPNGQSPITNLTLTTSQLVYVYAQSGTTPNCTDQKSFQVNITPSPQFTIEGGCVGSVYVLEITNANFNLTTANYNWSGPGTILNNGTPSVQVNTPGVYTCIVSVSNGSNDCSTSHFIDATEVGCEIPKGISPNGDGLNDTFDLRGFNVENLGIFNRYGKTVYSRNDYKNEWGGQSDSGNELPDGTYYYVIERKDGQETKTGWVYINREIR